LAAQQIPVVPLLAQFPLWHSRLVVHAPPLAAWATQLPPPSHARFDPQVVPTLAGDLLHTGAPVLQLIVPGLHVVPHAMPTVQDTHVPAPSQTWFVPQLVPAVALLWLQTRLPVVQLVVPGLQVVPQDAPAVHAVQVPLPSQTWLVPHVVPAAAFVALQTTAPVVQLVVPGLHVVPQAALIVQATQLPLASQTWLVPQDEPADLSVWFLQVGVPPLQSKVPGLQGEPQAAPAEQATQLPLPSQT
jgi:hypothetical protein